MNPNRIYMGWACLAAGFGIIVLLGTGLIEPPGLAGARSLRDLLAAFAPYLLLSLGLFVAGLWSIKGPKRR